MKHTIKIAPISLVAALLFNAAHGSIKNQSDLIKSKLKIGDYQTVAGYSGTVKITNIEPEKNQPHKHVIVTVGESKYFPGNIAFPVTYYRAFYEGNVKLQKKVGYTVTRGSHVGKERLVVVNDYVFLLNDWRNKDDYSVSRVFKVGNGGQPAKKNGLGSLLGAMVTVATGGSLEEDKGALKREVLQPYLDQATAKQKSYYATWIQDPTNAKTKQYLDDLDMAMTQAMHNYNKKIYNSPAHQRMLAHRRWMAKNVNMKVYNKKGTTIWIGSTEKAFITNEIGVGRDTTSSCTSDMYYYFSDKNGTPGTKFNSDGDNCSGSVTIR